MRVFQLLYFYCAATSILAADFGNHVTHERRSTALGLQQMSRLDGNSTIPIKIALAQRNLENAEEFLLSVSDPKSPQYAQYWTAAEVASKFSPSVQSLKHVITWLTTAGIVRTRLRGSRTKGEVHFNATVREAEQLFNTTYHVYENQETGVSYVGCDEYTLPSSIRKYIDFITPTIQLQHKLSPRQLASNQNGNQMLSESQQPQSSFVKRQSGPKSRFSTIPKRQVSSSLPDCSRRTTPDCLRALYHIPTDNTSHPDNSLGIVAFGWSSYLPKDLSVFFERFAPSTGNSAPILKSIDGGVLQDLVESDVFNKEPNLDLEYTMALTSPLNVTNYQVGDLQVDGEPPGMNDFLAAFDSSYCGTLDPQYDAIYPQANSASEGVSTAYNHTDCGTLKPSHVISVSYGQDEVSFTPSYERRQCLEYLKLGLQGVTMIFAAGDYGAAGMNNTCLDPATGTSARPGAGSHYQATFPATCPYITSVGGTKLAANSSIQDGEIAWETTLKMDGDDLSGAGDATQLISSGGGFSSVFPAPSYQCQVMDWYFQREQSSLLNVSTHFKPKLHGKSPRGYPDVAVNANGYYTIIDGNATTIYGTSGSAPVFASIIAKINDRRLKGGKRPVGFLNPVLYANPQIMNDIVAGSNFDCLGHPAFNATSGWDPVTGLGTPNFDRMLEMFMGLP